MTNRMDLPTDHTLIEPALVPPATIEEAIQMIGDEEVVEIVCEIVVNIPDESSPGHIAARSQRNHLARLWSAYMGGESIREILRELMYHFEGFECVEKWETYLMSLNT